MENTFEEVVEEEVSNALDLLLGASSASASVLDIIAASSLLLDKKPAMREGMEKWRKMSVEEKAAWRSRALDSRLEGANSNRSEDWTI